MAAIRGRTARALLVGAALAALAAGAAPAGAVAQPRDDARFATFNASLNRSSESSTTTRASARRSCSRTADIRRAEDRNGRRNSDEIRFWADYMG